MSGARKLMAAGGGVEFSPLDIADIQAWFDASDTATITDAGSGAVSQWNDKSGNAKHLTQATNGNRPITGTRTINGLNVLDFDGTDDVLKINEALIGVDNSLFVVARADTTHIGDICSSSRNITTPSYTRLVLVNSSIRLAVTDNGAADRLQLNSTTNLTSAPRLITATMDGFSSASLRINGTQEASSGAWSLPFVYSTNQFTVGRFEQASPIQPFNGMIAEIVIYDGALSSGDRDDVESYLNTKWGI